MDLLQLFTLPPLDLRLSNEFLVQSTKVLAQVILECDRLNRRGRGINCDEYIPPSSSDEIELVVSPQLLALVFEAFKFFAYNWVMWRICMLF